MSRKAVALVGRVSRQAAMTVSAEEQQRMIREAAYYHYLQRGAAHGHDLEDWLAAEAEMVPLESAAQVSGPTDIEEFEIQQSSAHGFRQDEALKRIIRQHPKRGIPQIEGIEPMEAPAKE